MNLEPASNYIPLSKIDLSDTNHRKHFDAAAMGDLAASIKQKGILTPIIVRPYKDRFEIVAGERRFRAAGMAGLKTVPAIVREMTDEEAREVQFIENSQRVDVHPMEEAEALNELLTLAIKRGEKDARAAVALRVGKPRDHVARRLVLLNLPKMARDAFRHRQIPIETALIIARTTDPVLREKLAKEITSPGNWQANDDGVLSVKDAAARAYELTMLNLKTAPFDTSSAELVPAAGACGPCPKRTGNAQDLFGGVEEKDTCTDPACFKTKVGAAWALKEAEAKAKGLRVLTPAETKKALNDHGDVQRDAGFLKPDDSKYDPRTGHSVTYKKLLGKAKPTQILAKNPKTGAPVVLWDAAEVKSLTRGLNPKKATAEDKEDKGAREREKKAKAKLAADDELARRIYVACRARIVKRQCGAHALSTALLIGLEDSLNIADKNDLELGGFASRKSMLSQCAGESELRDRLAVAVSIATGGFGDGCHHQDLDLATEIADALGVDVKAVRNEIALELTGKKK